MNSTEPDVLQLPTFSDFDKLFAMVESIKLNNIGFSSGSNRLGFPSHKNAVWGIIKKRFTNKIELSAFSMRHPEIWEEIKRIGKLICPFEFSSVQMNKNLVCPPHKDRKNKSKSVLISFGKYTGGYIVVEGVTYNAYHTPTIFDGCKLEHKNTEFEGTKYSLVFFN